MEQLSKRHLFSICIFITLCTFIACDDTQENAAKSTKVIEGQPIVIQTEARTYDNPTLAEYQKCHENLDVCMKACETEYNVDTCKTKCPTCPILIDHNYVVQGINDTEHSVVADPAINTTNVISLTNEIHNIINHSMGNITANNVNNIEIQQQNTSTIGGKFGMGYNANGPCCSVVRKTRNCGENSPHCPQKHYRVCGTKCKSRVMLAKRTTYCKESECHHRIEYVPYHRRVQRSCDYMPRWPYVTCRGQQQQQQQHENSCQHCMQLPFGYILRNGIPSHCIRCYQAYRPIYNPTMWYGPPAYYPNMLPTISREPPFYYDGDYDWDNDFLPEADGWKVEKTKCRDANGNIIENCQQTDEKEIHGNGNASLVGGLDGGDSVGDNGFLDGDYDDLKPVTDGEDPLQQLPEAQDEIFNEYEDELEGVDAVRHRRHPRRHFQRSAYSHRHRQEQTDQ